MEEEEVDYLLKPKRIEDQQNMAEERLAEIAREVQEKGDLRHLYGQPLDLSDDDPNWFIARELKNAGFSHPLIERGREVDALLEAAQKIADRLRRQRQWLASVESASTTQDVHAFNESRGYELESYRQELHKVNRAIRDYNLSVPDALHRRPVNVERQTKAIAEAIPPLDTPPPVARQSRPSLFMKAIRRLRTNKQIGHERP